jgi:hypothetical protein
MLRTYWRRLILISAIKPERIPGTQIQSSIARSGQPVILADLRQSKEAEKIGFPEDFAVKKSP